MQITIHRGAHEVGGNCIEIATANSRILLDVGMPLFDEDREPRDSSALRKKSKQELLDAGILPKVAGAFADGASVDAILLSHAHEDHTGLLGHSRPDVPIYASEGTSKMMMAGSFFANQPRLPQERYQKLTSRIPVQIGDFTVTAYSVDHSIFGAQAFLIEAEGKSVLYSGDLRMHGRKPGMHRDLIKAMSKRTIDVLLMEGTHIAHEGYRGANEYELEAEITRHIQGAKGLVLASFSPQHFDRLIGFYRASLKSSRIFVADAYAAFVFHVLASLVKIPRPEAMDGLRVFFPMYFDGSGKQRKLKNFCEKVSGKRITLKEIREDPSRYVMVFRPSMLKSDFDGALPPGSRCLHSRWAGYLEKPDCQPVNAALIHAKGDLIQVHTSGHIYADDIVKFVKQINAKTVIPVHTFEGERFQERIQRVRLLHDGEVETI